jgi:hypothetical protein
MTLGRCRPGLRGIPGPIVAQQPKPPSISPRELDLPSRALEGAPGRLAPTPTLLGFVRVPPLRRYAFLASTPGSRSPLRPDGATRRTRSAFVVSHHHDGLLRSKGRGFIAPRNRPGVRRVSRHPVARTVRPEGQRAQVAGVVPRDAVHTLRRLPSPTAVPHHCGRCPHAVTVADRSRDMAEATTRLRNPLDRSRAGLTPPALRGAWLATGQRRDARYDDAPIRRSGPPRHRAHAASAAPKRRMAAGAEPPQPPPAPRCRPWPGEVEPPPGLATPTVLSGPWGRPKAVRRVASRPRPRDTEGLAPPAEAGESRARRTNHGAADFKALLHRRVRRVASAVASGTTLVPSMGFVPLQGSLAFRADPAVPSRRGPLWPNRGSTSAALRACRPSAANRFEATCNRDPFPSSPPLPCRSTVPGRRRGAEAESNRRAFSARPRDPRWRVLLPPLGRSRGRTLGRCP